MKKIRYLILLCFLLSLSSLYCCEEQIEISYPNIESWTEWNIDFILDEGEKDLIKGEFSSAHENFTKAISLCRKEKNQDIRLCRALFDRTLSSTALELQTTALEDVHHLEKVLGAFQCQKASNEYVAGKPILGPEEIPMKECLEMIDNTISMAKDILSIAPVKFQWKASVMVAINLAGDKARGCCKAGGLWKACLQPLFVKWMDLKEWERQCRRSGHWYAPAD